MLHHGDYSDTGDTSKSLLVCLGERKRPISLSSNASFNDLPLGTCCPVPAMQLHRISLVP